MKTALSVLFFILFYFTSASSVQENDLTLELLQVIFRHGDRVPDDIEIYKTDPHYPQEYETIGYGQLTEVGKLRMYKFGQMLRQKYDNFLGDYRFNEIYAYSTERDRTKISLQAVLAGLYPSKNSCDNNTLTSVLIPTHYDNKDISFMRSFYKKPCQKYVELAEEAKTTPEIRSRFEKYRELQENLTNFTGSSMYDIINIHKLYNNIRAGMSMNLSQPSWLTDEIYKDMQNVVTIRWDILAFSESMKKISAGPMIKNFLTNIENSNKKSDGGKKIYLYSGHDTNVAAFTRAHNFFNSTGNPDYGSAVIIEKLRGKDNQVYLRMFFWTGVTEKMIPLKFDEVGYEIPLNTYTALIQSILPGDDCN